MRSTDPIYKICSKSMWESAQQVGRFVGAEIDLTDGFIHFSTRQQVRETAAKHFADHKDLVLLTVDPVGLGEQLKWEASRAGDLFPHLYDAFPVAAVMKIDRLPLDDRGQHRFPAEVP